MPQWYHEEEFMSVTAHLMKPQKTRVSDTHVHAFCGQWFCFPPSATCR